MNSSSGRRCSFVLAWQKLAHTALPIGGEKRPVLLVGVK